MNDNCRCASCMSYPRRPCREHPKGGNPHTYTQWVAQVQGARIADLTKQVEELVSHRHVLLQDIVVRATDQSALRFRIWDLEDRLRKKEEDLATATDRIQADAKTIDRMHQSIAQMRAERRHLG